MSTATLGEIAEFVNGAAFKPEDWHEAGLPIIRIQNLTDPSKPFNRTQREVSEKLHVLPGDLLVSWSATLGVFEWPADAEEAVLNQHIFRVLPRRDRVDKGYLMYALDRAISDMTRHLHGATMKHVNRREFLGTEVPLPPIEEQRRIAAVLEEADRLRAKRRASLAKMDSLNESIFFGMFGDRRYNRLQAPIVSLAELVDPDNPITRGIDQPGPDVEGGVPYIKTTDFGAPLRRDSLARAAPEIAAKFPRSVVRPGDSVICIRATVGPVALVEEELSGVNLSRGTARVSPAAGVEPRYLLGCLQSADFQNQVRERLRGATFLQIPLGELKRLEVMCPDPDSQREYVRRVERAGAMRCSAEDHQAGLKDLFESLQQRAFAGQL